MSRFLIKPYFCIKFLPGMRSVVILSDVGSCMRGAETMDPRKVFFPPSMACASYRVMFLLLRLKLHIYDRLMNKCAFDYLFPGVFQHPFFPRAAVFPNFSLSSSVHASRSSRWGNLWGKNLFGRTGAFFWGKTVLMPNLRPCSAGLVDRMQRPMWNTWSTRAHPLRLLLEPKELWIKMWTGSAKRHNLVTFGLNCGRK